MSTASAVLENPREVISDLILAVLARVLAESHGVPDAILLWDDGFSPDARDLVRQARIAMRCICDLAPFFGLQVRPNSQMLPLDPSLSKAQRAIVTAVVSE